MDFLILITMFQEIPYNGFVRNVVLARRSFKTPTCAADVKIPSKFKVTISNESFLLYDSGVGDNNRLLIFSTPKTLSILRDCNSWYADGAFKIAPKHLFQVYTIHAERMALLFLAFMLWWQIRVSLAIILF